MNLIHKFPRRHTLLVTLVVLAVAIIAAPAMAKGERAPGDMTIYEIAAGSEDFETLTFALEATGLDVVLDGDGQYTVFAPTDDAFAALETANPGITAALVADPALLESVLLYHVTDGRRWSNSLVNKNNAKQVEMLSGGFISVTPMAKVVDADSLGLSSPDAEIESANLSASNGVVHVISEVLIP